MRWIINHSNAVGIAPVTVNRPNGPSREIAIARFTGDDVEIVTMCSADDARAIAAQLQEAADTLQSGKDLQTLNVHTGELS